MNKTAKFELYTDRAVEHRFRPVAPNGEVIAVGEGYTTRQGCLRGVEAVRKYALGAVLKDAP